MNMLSRNWLPDAIGACALVAGLCLLAVVTASGDPIGQSVAALMGGGLAAGLLGCVWKEASASRAKLRRAVWTQSEAPTPAIVLAMPPAADATASEYDDSVQPSFAAVVSLTEAQVERQRARQPQKRHPTLNRA